MKHILIRKGVFETNSSSAHSVSIADDTKEFVLDTLYPDQNGQILLTGGEFGWEWFKHNDALTKANYAAQSFEGNENHQEMLIDIIKEMTGADEVIFDCENGYIDHDSYGTAPTNREELKSFIFNKNSWLFGGNDNSTPDPTFYHVPEFKAGRMILPEYKYELKVEGFDKTTKFLKKPSKDELVEGLSALLGDVKLYDMGNGYYFDNDRSVYGMLNRREGYYEYSSWKRSINTRKKEIYFTKDAWQDARDQWMSIPGNDQKDWGNVGYKEVREIKEKLLQTPEYYRAVKYSLIDLKEKVGK